MSRIRLREKLHRLSRQQMLAIGFVVLIALVGTYLLIISRAASPGANFQAESGTLSTNATQKSDSTASGGAAVKFGQGGGGGGGGVPVRVASFGPNGTHWPSRTPWPEDSGLVVIDVAADWTAIANAIDSVTAAQDAQGVVIKVAPGSLAGMANGNAIIKTHGSATWSKRVLIIPRDGYGTVSFSSQVKIYNVPNVVWAGFKGAGINLVASTGGVIAWSSFSGYISDSSDTGFITSDTGFVEVAMTNFRVVDSGDQSDMTADHADFNNAFVVGSYMAPVYYNIVTYPSCSLVTSPHTDTFQTVQVSGNMNNLLLQDSAFFAASNSAVQVGSAIGIHFDHTYVIDGTLQQSRYGHLPNGANSDGTPCAGRPAASAINGGGNNHTFLNSIILGKQAWSSSNAQTRYTSTTGSIVNAQSNPLYGPAFTVDSSYTTNPRMPAIPTDAYLQSIWQF